MTSATNISQCHVWIVRATIISSVRIREVNVMDTTWMKSWSKRRRPPNIMIPPETNNNVSFSLKCYEIICNILVCNINQFSPMPKGGCRSGQRWTRWIMEDLKTQFLLRLILSITTDTERLTHKKKTSSGNLLERMLDGGNRQYGIIKGGFPVIITTERINPSY